MPSVARMKSGMLEAEYRHPGFHPGYGTVACPLSLTLSPKGRGDNIQRVGWKTALAFSTDAELVDIRCARCPPYLLQRRSPDNIRGPCLA